MAKYHGDMPFDRSKGTLTMRGVAWQREDRTGDWLRHMLRVYADGSPYWSKTFRLQHDDLPFCLQCLSLNVTFHQADPDGTVTWCCHDCDLGFFRVAADG